MKNLLFITHETTRTGAPLVLLYFLQWLQKHQKEVKVDVVALKGGDLDVEFKNACHTYYNYKEQTASKPFTIGQRVLKKLGFLKKPEPLNEFLKLLKHKGYDVVYVNTVMTLPIAKKIKEGLPNAKIIAHIHELDTIVKIMLPDFKDYIPITDKFIVPSQLVKKQLLTNWGVSLKIVEVVYECTQIDKHNNAEKTKNNIFTVGASGTVHWRKGHDLFIQLARYLKDNHPDSAMNFVWVGRIPQKEKNILEADLQKTGLSQNVEFVGEIENPSSYYNEFDVFVMTSREDPFPLVCIEVGMLGKPIICFKDATGTEEIIKERGGAVVPYLNIEVMAQKIVAYFENPDLVKEHGSYNQEAFLQFTPEIICPQLFEIIVDINSGS